MSNNDYLKKALVCLGIFVSSSAVYSQEGVWNGSNRSALTAGGAAAIGQPISIPVRTNSSPITLTQGVEQSPVPSGALTPGVPPAVPSNVPPPGFGNPPPPSGFGNPPIIRIFWNQHASTWAMALFRALLAESFLKATTPSIILPAPPPIFFSSKTLELLPK